MKILTGLLLIGSLFGQVPNNGGGGSGGSSVSVTANSPWICVPASASGTTYTCTPTLLDGTAIPAGQLSAPANGQQLIFIPDVNNTGAVTIQIDGATAHGARYNRQIGAPLTFTGQANSLIAAQLYLFLWKAASAFWVMTPVTNGIGDGITISNSTTFIGTLAYSPVFAITSASLSAAVTSTLLYTPITTRAFRISYYAKVITPGTSSILGGTTGLVLTYTDGTDSVVQTAFTMPEDNQAGTALSIGTGNTTNTNQAVIHGSAIIYALQGAAINYAFGYSSTGTTMVYSLIIKVEAL